MLEAIIALLAGLLIGSFLNVCIYRLPRDLSVVKPRSHCPYCEHKIAWFDNIPIVSYALLKGRCRHCRQPISLRYPLVEGLTAALFCLAAVLHGATFVTLKLWAFSAILVCLIFADLEERILPDEFTLGGIAEGLLFSLVDLHPPGLTMVFVPRSWPLRWVSFSEALFAAAFTMFALWAIGAAYQKLRHKEGLGLGDVKMVAMLGAFLGLMPTLLALMGGSILGAVVGLIYIRVAKKDAGTYELPFGSFLGIAAIVVAFLS